MQARRVKACKYCQNEFRPRTSTQGVCSVACSIRWAREQEATKAERAARKAAKIERSNRREARERLKTRKDLLKEAQIAFNAWIRFRDRGLPCISCDEPDHGEAGNGGFFDCGHYRTVGACPELRFHEDNAHKQCKRCNSGVVRSRRRVHTVHDPERQESIRAAYRIRLIAKIGLPRVEWLEGPHEPAKWTPDTLRSIRQHYRARLRNDKRIAAGSSSIQ